MRKQDIIITTPKHSTIYAFGTVPESYDSVWGDLDTHRTRAYTPAYVLAIRDSGFVTALVANNHPDNPYIKARAERNEPGAQAGFLEASEYTLADHDERNEFMRIHSHWATNEEKQVYVDGLAKLKPLPQGWRVATVRASDIRMLWAEYTERHNTAIGERKARKQLQKDAEKRAEQGRKDALDRVAALNIGLSEKDVKDKLRSRYTDDDEVRIPVVALNRLLDVYEDSLVDEVSR